MPATSNHNPHTSKETHTMTDTTRTLPCTTRDMVAVMRDQADILGHITFYMLPSVKLPYLASTDAWRAAGLPTQVIARPPSADATFKDSCRALETRRHLGQALEIRVAQVTDNTRQVVFQITWQVILADQQTAEYPKALRITLDKRTESIDHQVLGNGTHQQFTGPDGEPIVLPDPTRLAAQVRAEFTEHRHDMPMETFRRMVKETLKACQATSLRSSGGVSFVPAANRDLLKTLGEVVMDLTGQKAEWVRIPVAGDTDIKRMVREHFIANCSEELDAQITRIRQLRANTNADCTIGTRAINAVIRETQRLARLKAAYQQALSDELGELDLRMQVLQAQVGGLVGCARPGAAVIDHHDTTTPGHPGPETVPPQQEAPPKEGPEVPVTATAPPVRGRANLGTLFGFDVAA